MPKTIPYGVAHPYIVYKLWFKFILRLIFLPLFLDVAMYGNEFENIKLEPRTKLNQNICKEVLPGRKRGAGLEREVCSN